MMLIRGRRARLSDVLIDSLVRDSSKWRIYDDQIVHESGVRILIENGVRVVSPDVITFGFFERMKISRALRKLTSLHASIAESNARARVAEMIAPPSPQGPPPHPSK